MPHPRHYAQVVALFFNAVLPSFKFPTVHRTMSKFHLQALAHPNKPILLFDTCSFDRVDTPSHPEFFRETHMPTIQCLASEFGRCNGQGDTIMCD